QAEDGIRDLTVTGVQTCALPIFGLKRADGGEKLLYRLWAEGGIHAVRDAYWLGKSAHVGNGKDKPVLITGGSGFIGTNLAHRVRSEERRVGKECRYRWGP